MREDQEQDYRWTKRRLEYELAWAKKTMDPGNKCYKKAEKRRVDTKSID